MLNQIEFKVLKGEEGRQYWREIAQLRIEMFREFPYLYEGCIAYEEDYLNMYFNSPHSLIILILSQEKVVGFSSSIPLAEEMEELRSPFLQQGWNLREYLYIGELMLQPAYRGQGFLRQFLETHEDKARREGYKFTFFATVDRPFTHPCRPRVYRDLETIWQHFNYKQLKEVDVAFSWLQVDTGIVEHNPMSVWLKKLA